jgi:hypothetical protein
MPTFSTSSLGFFLFHSFQGLVVFLVKRIYNEFGDNNLNAIKNLIYALSTMK